VRQVCHIVAILGWRAFAFVDTERNIESKSHCNLAFIFYGPKTYSLNPGC
jgi:hypothetical protein